MTERTNHTLAVKTTKVEILSSEERLPIKVKEEPKEVLFAIQMQVTSTPSMSLPLK